MPLSAVQISNIALANIGILQGIADFTESSNEAQACSLFYETVVDEVVAGHQWRFANRTATLGLVGYDPTDSWSYSFRMPSDCLLPISIGKDVPYTLSADSTGGLLYTNQETVTLEYTKRITDPAAIPVLVALAIAWRLGQYMATPLARTQSIADTCKDNYNKQLALALETDLGSIVTSAEQAAETIAERE